jgi:molybdenum cofactor cytidylyltransferase
MGEPKQLLALDGKPLLEHTLANLGAANVSHIVVVLGFASNAIRQQVALGEVRVVENADYEQGMASSLRVGLTALDPRTDAALVVLADQPLVRPETLNRIIADYEQSDAKIVVPTYQGFRGNPVLLDRSVFPEVMALRGDIGCRAVFGNHREGIVKAAVDDIGVLLDIDTEDDIAKLRRYGQSVENPAALLKAVDLQGRSLGETGGGGLGDHNRLIIVGTEPVAIALARVARLLQFRVTMVDPLLQHSDLPEVDEVLNVLDLSRVPSAIHRYLVVTSRGRFDEDAIEQGFAANLEYIGLVANRNRAAEVRRRLQDNGHAADRLVTLRAPAGLEIGANTPEEIALSILAEIVAVKQKRRGKDPVAR